MTQFAIAVRTGYTYGNQWKGVVIEVDKITPLCVFAAGFWNRQVRYVKKDYKFKFFDTEQNAKDALLVFKEKCSVNIAERMMNDASEAQMFANDMVKREVETWD